MNDRASSTAWSESLVSFLRQGAVILPTYVRNEAGARALLGRGARVIILDLTLMSRVDVIPRLAAYLQTNRETVAIKAAHDLAERTFVAEVKCRHQR